MDMNLKVTLHFELYRDDNRVEQIKMSNKSTTNHMNSSITSIVDFVSMLVLYLSLSFSFSLVCSFTSEVFAFHKYIVQFIETCD